MKNYYLKIFVITIFLLSNVGVFNFSVIIIIIITRLITWQERNTTFRYIHPYVCYNMPFWFSFLWVHLRVKSRFYVVLMSSWHFIELIVLYLMCLSSNFFSFFFFLSRFFSKNMESSKVNRYKSWWEKQTLKQIVSQSTPKLIREFDESGRARLSL